MLPDPLFFSGLQETFCDFEGQLAEKDKEISQLKDALQTSLNRTDQGAPPQRSTGVAFDKRILVLEHKRLECFLCPAWL